MAPSAAAPRVERSAVDQVRRFNRIVTERIGALRDDYLARGRPLGASRILWELAEQGTEVGELRARFELDSGHLSRLLRVLEAQGLVGLEAGKTDRRRRRVRPTPKGRAERAVLDRLSDELAASLLAPLDEHERERLVEAMATVERLLTAGLVELRVEDPETKAARHCLEAYFAELDRRFEGGFDPGRALPLDAAALRKPRGLLLVARLRGEPVGCGALKFHGSGPGEIKRLWVAEAARGLGLGRRLLHELESQARRRGLEAVRLDTNRSLGEAIRLYRSSGYVEVPPYNEERYAHHWFEKRLGP